MATTIKIKGGKGEIPALEDRELGYSKDGKTLYIGTPDGNVMLCSAEVFRMLNELNARLATLENKIN